MKTQYISRSVHLKKRIGPFHLFIGIYSENPNYEQTHQNPTQTSSKVVQTKQR